MKYSIHPKRILIRKLDNINSTASFYFQNLIAKYLNSKIFFFRIKKTNYKNIQINLVLDNEPFSRYFFKSMSLSLNSRTLSYFIKGPENRYPSFCNLKYFGKEIVNSSDLHLNRHFGSNVYDKTGNKKNNSRKFTLFFKELLAFNGNLFIFSTISGLQEYRLKSLLINEECLNVNLFFDESNLVSHYGEKNKVYTLNKRNNFISIITVEFCEKYIISIYKKKEKFWFEYNLKNKNFISNNFLILVHLRNFFLPKNLLSLSFIHTSHWNDKKANMYFLNLKNMFDWIVKEINLGCKENDLNFKNPICLDHSLFIKRKSISLISNLFPVSLIYNYESFVPQIFIFSIFLNLNKKSKRWKKKSVCLNHNFNKLLFKLNNSAFRQDEKNSTFGFDCSRENFLIFTNLFFQKIYDKHFHIKIKGEMDKMSLIRTFDFKNYSFLIGKSSNYSNF